MTRLDQALVERALCDSREKAKRLILAGSVRINGHPAKKASDSVKPADAIIVDTPEIFISRGGHKLEHALEHFQLNVTGLTVELLVTAVVPLSDSEAMVWLTPPRSKVAPLASETAVVTGRILAPKTTGWSPLMALNHCCAIQA